jgi:hypothetical protein
VGDIFKNMGGFYMGKISIDSDVLEQILANSAAQTDTIAYLDYMESITPKSFSDNDYLRSFTMGSPYTLENNDLMNYVKRLYMSSNQRKELKEGSLNRADQYLMGFGVDPRLIGHYIHMPYVCGCTSQIKASKGVIVKNKKCDNCKCLDDKMCSKYQRPIVPWIDILPTMQGLAHVDKKVYPFYGEKSMMHKIMSSITSLSFLKKYSGKGNSPASIFAGVSQVNPILVGILARKILVFNTQAGDYAPITKKETLPNGNVILRSEV